MRIGGWWSILKARILAQEVRWCALPRRRRSKRRSGPRRKGRRARPATNTRTQRSRKTIVVIETRGRGPAQTTVHEEFYEEEW